VKRGITRRCIVCGEWCLVPLSPETFHRWRDGIPVEILAGNPDSELFRTGICAQCRDEILDEAKANGWI
jgi:hypothetical protein